MEMPLSPDEPSETTLAHALEKSGVSNSLVTWLLEDIDANPRRRVVKQNTIDRYVFDAGVARPADLQDLSPEQQEATRADMRHLLALEEEVIHNPANAELQKQIREFGKKIAQTIEAASQ